MTTKTNNILSFFIFFVSLFFLFTIDVSAEEYQSSTIYKAQKALSEKGYQIDQIDGVLDTETQKTIKNYQLDNDLNPSGDLDDETVKKLLGEKEFIKRKKAKTLDDIHQFQSFFEDSTISSDIYIDSGLNYSSYNIGDQFSLGCRGGYPIFQKSEVNMGFNLLFGDFYRGDSEFGISDLYLGGKYLFYDKKAKISAGGFLTVPIGNKDVDQNNFSYGINCAARYPLNNKIVFTGSTGIARIEQLSIKNETSFSLGSGCIYKYNDQTHFLGEFLFKTEINIENEDYMMFSGGIDYRTRKDSHIRGIFGYGFDDGAPDYQFGLSFLL